MATIDKLLMMDALKKWGKDSQLSMAMGECGELIAAINRKYTQGRGNLDDVAEEVADVMIMMEQMTLIILLEAEQDLVHSHLIEKQQRLRKVLHPTSNPND